MINEIKHYCYHAIANTAHRCGLTARSSKWPKLRNRWLRDNPICTACGGKHCLQVHHKKPFRLYPELELDPLNLITLCERKGSNHHLQIGHLGNWKKFNPDVEKDAAKMKRSTDTF